MKIGFITGARSEYGVMKNVIRSLAADDRFNVCIIATGMHFQKKYGYKNFYSAPKLFPF